MPVSKSTHGRELSASTCAVEPHADVARAAQDVDAMMRVARVDEDLLVLLEPGVHRVPAERDVPADALPAGRRALVAPGVVDGLALADAHRPVRRLAARRAVRAVRARHEQVLAHVLAREVVVGELVERRLVAAHHQERALRAGDLGAAEAHAHTPVGRLEAVLDVTHRPRSVRRSERRQDARASSPRRSCSSTVTSASTTCGSNWQPALRCSSATASRCPRGPS